MRSYKYFSVLLFCSSLAAVNFLPAHAQGRAAANGGGTYFVEPGIRSEFQFGANHVQCKIGHAVLPDGTSLQMYMASLTIDTVNIDSAAKSAVITGSMVSIVQLRSGAGAPTTLTETVPFVAYAKDNGTPGAGADFFSLSVHYTPTAGLDQADLFGINATFAGTVETGNIEIH